MSGKPLAFISHSAHDVATANRLAERLRERGVDVWIDSERIRPGDSIVGRISEGLDQADVLLVLVSRAFLESSWSSAEYEPALKREIDGRRTIVIPVLLEDVELPSLLAAKRYLDLRSGPEGDLSELISQIDWNLPTARVLRLVPKSPSPEGSALALIIGGTLDQFPVSLLPDEQLLAGRGLVDLYRTVDRLVERFQALCDEIVPILVDDAPEEGRAGRQGPLHDVPAANRRLQAIAMDMREIATQVDAMLERDSRLRRRLTDVSKLSMSVATLESNSVELLIGVPEGPDPDRWPSSAQVDDQAVLRGEEQYADVGPAGLRALQELQTRLDDYRRQLRAAIAATLADDG